MRLRPLVLGALLAAGTTLAGPAAHAAPAGAPLLPGGEQRLVVALPGSWVTDVDQLAVSAGALDQREHGCLPPERAAGDTSCGDDEGDLAGQLRAEVAGGVAVGADCRPTGAAEPLSLAEPAVVTRLGVRGADCLVVRLTFPDGADDDLAQGDTLAVALRVVATGPGAGPAPAAPGSSSTSSTSSSPSTSSTSSSGSSSSRGQLAVGGTRGAAVPPGGVPVAGPGTVAGELLGGGAPLPEAAAPGAGNRAVGSWDGDLTVGADGVRVQTESVAASLGDRVLVWSAVLMGATSLGGLLWVVWRRRRGRRA